MTAVPLRTTGTLKKYIQFSNIKSSLVSYGTMHSETFYLDFTSWQVYITKIQDEGSNAPYLSVYLSKVDDEYQNQFSYHVRKSFTMLSNHTNLIMSDSLNSRSKYVYGKRNGESMGWGAKNGILWGNLLNPQLGYVDKDDDTIEIELNMELVKVMSHNKNCKCRAC